jgi:FMN phosphatase YigB (HAD superfamily)
MIKPSTKLLLLSDIDAVVSDWFVGYREFMLKVKGIESTGELPTIFHMLDVFPDLEKPWEHIMEYQESEHYKSMPVYDDVAETLVDLNKIGVEVHFITSCGDTHKIQTARNEYMSEKFGGLYEIIHYLGLGEDKTAVFDMYKDVSVPVVYIDDQEKMLLPAEQFGFKTVLKNMAYNRCADGKYHRVSGYAELGELIKSML